MSRLIDRTGQKYGRLLVLHRAPDKIFSSGRTVVQWHCKCDCGKEVDVPATSLASGGTKSCGCWNDEQRKNPEAKASKHHMRNTRLYSIWRGMKKRCLTSSENNHPNYYHKHISICEEWKDDFSTFAQWALSHGYDDTLSLDRINNQGNYEPNNCRWSTNTEQQRNKDNNRLITYDNETHCLAEWAEITGIHRSTIAGHIKRGWSLGRALFEPPR